LPISRSRRLTAREVSRLLGDIPTKTVLQYAREGRLPCLKIGRHVRFVRSELDHALRTQRRPAARV
jgi:excisionase family DNA binding protein